jgi:phenylalanyl-tRNA synthetase beta chain
MKIPITWLKNYINIDTDTISEVSRLLTMSGTEVSSVIHIGQNLDKKLIIVAQITSIESHPNADKLKIVNVNIGETQSVEVVCGADNISIGQKIVLARPGAGLTNPKTGKREILKESIIRGVKSDGMICSGFELGLNSDNDGIMVLDEKHDLGIPVYDLVNDVVIETELTPNRPDCLSIIGTAYEIAAITDQNVRLPQDNYSPSSKNIGDLVEVNIEDSTLCSRYSATIIHDVCVQESPAWLKDYLVKSGQRCINNIVDITNFVMLEYGQPLHAFDFTKINGNQVIVRHALAHETITTLDGLIRTLYPPMLVIADKDKPIALAGIMGAANSEVDSTTNTIFLESANFDASNTRNTRTILGINTEASYRFERYLRPELSDLALKRAIKLIADVAKGIPVTGIIDVYPNSKPIEPIFLRITKLNNILGTNFDKNVVIKILESLGFEVVEESVENSQSKFLIKTPYWRSDVQIEEDLIEEFARIYGYDNLPTTAISSSIPSIVPSMNMQNREYIRDNLVSAGLNEIISYSVMSPIDFSYIYSDIPEKDLVKLSNPMDSNKPFLRASLRQNVLEILSNNLKISSYESLSLFEIGRVFLPIRTNTIEGMPLESEHLIAVLSGNRSQKSLWQSDTGSFDFYDGKGVVEHALSRLPGIISFVACDEKIFSSGHCASIYYDQSPIGNIGVVSHYTLNHFDIDVPTVLLEIRLDDLYPLLGQKEDRYSPISKYPSSERDVSLIVPGNITSSEIKVLIDNNSFVVNSYVIDSYEGEGVNEDKKSLTYRIIFQSMFKTLATKDIDKEQYKIIKSLNHILNVEERYDREIKN